MDAITDSWKSNTWLFFFKTYKRALAAAAICSCLSAALKAYHNYGADLIWWEENMQVDSSAYAGFSFFLSLLFSFRTSQAYNRFWEGCNLVHGMCGDLYDAASSIISFCDHSSADRVKISEFQHILVRMFSLQTALILSHLEGSKVNDELPYELLDCQGLDEDTIQTIIVCEDKPEVVYQKIQRLLVANVKAGILSMPPPILSRSFQELSNGMLKYHEAVKLFEVPFPWAYSVIIELLLVAHFFLTPLTVVVWTTTSFWAAVFAGCQIFLLWSLASLALELDNPFKHNVIDLDCEYLQNGMNHRLASLLYMSASSLPSLSSSAVLDASVLLGTGPRRSRAPVAERLHETEHRKPRVTTVLNMVRESLVSSVAQRPTFLSGHAPGGLNNPTIGSLGSALKQQRMAQEILRSPRGSDPGSDDAGSDGWAGQGRACGDAPSSWPGGLPAVPPPPQGSEDGTQRSASTGGSIDFCINGSDGRPVRPGCVPSIRIHEPRSTSKEGCAPSIRIHEPCRISLS